MRPRFRGTVIATSWRDSGGGICEVNAAVGLTHLRATSLDIRGKIIEAFYPERDDGRIPTAMLTGTVGKSATSRMLASILSCAGHTVGCATTDGVTIGTEMVERGDLANVEGAAIVLRDATATAAVLEATSEGLAKEGMYLDRCDVAALLNVQPESIEHAGVETLDQVTALMRKVLNSAHKAVALNADDPTCLALALESSHVPKTILFSRSSAAVRDHVARGGEALVLDADEGGEVMILLRGSDRVQLVKTTALRDGALAAVAIALGLGIGIQDIRAGLRSFA